jgi:NADH-quinone oxidoreductase subunit N
MATDLFYGLLPEHLLLALVLVLMLFEMAGVGKVIAGFLFSLVSLAGCFILFRQLGQDYSAVLVANEIQVDHFALLARLVVLGCGFVYGACQLTREEEPKFWMLLAASLIGASMIMVSSGFISLFLGIELLSLPGFAMMVYRSGSAEATEGAFKYLLLSAVASAMVLFGISLAYGSVGTLKIADLAAALPQGGLLILAATTLILCGLFLKAAVFPFHGWAPDAYSGARLQVTTYLASGVKAAVVLAMVRIFGNATLSSGVIGLIIVLGVGSIFFGNLSAIRQTTFRRLLAYSSIAHAGYMIFALTNNTGVGGKALLYYAVVYALTTIVACTSFSMLVPQDDDNLDSLDGAFSSRPLPALLLAASALSLAGIPPLPGFIAKLLIFKSVVASGHLQAAVLAFTGSFVGVTYYLGIVGRLFKPATVPAAAGGNRSGWSMSGVLLGAALLVIFVIVPRTFF